MPNHLNNTFKVPRKIIFIFVVVLLAIILSGMYTKKITIPDDLTIPQLSKSSPSLPKRDVYIGFWTFGLWDDSTKSLHPEKLEKIENEIGKKVAIAHYFRGWHHLEESEFVSEMNTLSSHGWRPMVSANPYFFEGCQAKGMTLYKAISVGNCDEFLHRVAKNLKLINQPFFFRFAWEMNVNSMEWSVMHSGSYNEEFISSWRRFHDIVKEEGVTNISWVFSPQIETPSTTDISKLYPGDDYVDWVALDGYNWGTTKSWSKWQDFSAVFFNSYTKLKSLAPDKPFMIAEVNTTDVGGDRGAWYTNMLVNEIPNIFTDIDAIIFFNEDKTKQEGVNWLIDNTPDSLEQFKKGISNPIYKSHF